jgi:FMN phosphatase YigB (HAD superfamily)
LTATGEPSLTIFLDDGGVINDNSLRGPQWRRLVGEFFPPRLGGTAAAWSEANGAIFPAVWYRFIARLQDWDAATRSYQRELELYDLDWLRSMCAVVGVEPPVEDECLRLAREAAGYIQPKVRAAHPGAAETVRQLSRSFPLYTAAGGASYELKMMFEPLGIIGCFKRIYGPDLVNVPKMGPAFYRAIFADAGVDSATALVVDNEPRAIGWARAAGAEAILVSDPVAEGDDVPSILSLSALPARLGPLTGLHLSDGFRWKEILERAVTRTVTDSAMGQAEEKSPD